MSAHYCDILLPCLYTNAVVYRCAGGAGKKDNKHGAPHHNTGASAEMLRWANNDFSDGEKLLEVTDCTPLFSVTTPLLTLSASTCTRNR